MNMTTVQPPKLNAIDFIVKYWVVLVFLFGTLTAWVTLNSKVDAHSDEIQSLKVSNALSATTNNQILVELSGIRADLVWLKNNFR